MRRLANKTKKPRGVGLCSLEESSRLLLVFEEVVDPLGNHASRLLKLGRIAVARSVELDAVATVVAVGHASNLVELFFGLHLSSPLPRVFDTVSEEDVWHGDVPASLVNRGLLSLGLLHHTFAEGALAHLVPVRHLKHGRSHNVLLARHLEPAVLRTVLEGPRSGRIEWIDDGHCNLSCVVVARIDASNVVTEGCHAGHNFILACPFVVQRLQVGAHFAPIAVLDRLQEDVCVVEHPVVGSHAF